MPASWSATARPRSRRLWHKTDSTVAHPVLAGISYGDAAEEAANLRLATKAAGLSLGGRACLALARQLDLPAVTADRTWEGLELPDPVAVVVIR